MIARYFAHDELQQGVPGLDDPLSLLYTASGPMPALILVWRHPETDEVLLRYTTMTPLTWEPFSMMVSFPLDDMLVTATLHEGARCVMAWGSRDTVRAHYLAALDLPPGLDQLAIARLHPVASPYGPVPHIKECPLNTECHVDRIVDHNGWRTYWLIIEAMSLDEEILPLPREVVLQRYHLYQADRVSDGAGGEQLRLGLGGALLECPRFPVGPKSGWYSTFPHWAGELCDEGYLSPDEHARIIGWHTRYLELFDEVDNPERIALHDRLTAVCTALCWQEWPELHALLAG